MNNKIERVSKRQSRHDGSAQTLPPRRRIDRFFKNVTVGTLQQTRSTPSGTGRKVLCTPFSSLRFGISYFLSPDEHQSSGQIKDNRLIQRGTRSLFETSFCTVPTPVRPVLHRRFRERKKNERRNV